MVIESAVGQLFAHAKTHNKSARAIIAQQVFHRSFSMRRLFSVLPYSTILY